MRKLIENLTVVPEEPEGDAMFDSEGLIHRLLLFDRVIVVSSRLREFAPMVRSFGVDGVIALLRSGAVSVLCQAVTLGSVGQTDLRSREKYGLLPPLSLSFATVRAADPKEYLHGCFKAIGQIPDL